jgi:phosphopantothenoylcysteine decarboxylase/phosphopantothenate--cysteine ligase
MAEPTEIIELITKELNEDLPLTNKKILITAGPTNEPIDPVRFIGNRSSGKMGIALAIEAANQGAKVDLVLGPTNLDCKHANITVHKIETAEQMYRKVDAIFDATDISIFAAAVADYTPEVVAENKIKKSAMRLSISLINTTDILAAMGEKKRANQVVVGFALETENEIANAQKKLNCKKLDMIVLNSLNNKGAGFQYNTNKITIIDKENNITDYELKDKSEVAKDIINKIIEIS